MRGLYFCPDINAHLQSILNISLFSRSSHPLPIIRAMKRRRWFPKIKYDISSLIEDYEDFHPASSIRHDFELLNEPYSYVTDRGHIIDYNNPTIPYLGKLAVCAYVSNSTDFNFLILYMFTDDMWTWIILALGVLIMVTIHKKVGSALDLFLPLLGEECRMKHRRDIFLFFGMSLTILNWMLDGKISADQADFSYINNLVQISD